MAEPLKNIFSPALLASFAGEVQAVQPAFPVQNFLAAVFDPGWAALELKQRVRHISRIFRDTLPAAYPAALAILVRVTEGFLARHGEKMTFEYTFLPDFVEAFGEDDPDHSLPALEIMTRWSSAEFAIRPFLRRYPERLHAQMLAWSVHPSPLVRRLSSEGFRPRLPWGMGVPALKRDPAPILPVLENLKNDPAETVRRSVANNLNDIAKDHPDLVLDLAQRWRGHSAETDRLLRHACRGLLKRGDAAALAQFGFEQGVAGMVVDDLRCPASVPIGGRLDFAFTVANTGAAPVNIRLEYGIDYRTGTGKTSVKVFKIRELQLSPGQRESLARHQRFTDFTTRKHYPGPHRLHILLNGQVMGSANFVVV